MKKIKLNKIIANNLSERQLKNIKGGACYCSCSGPSSSYDNGSANHDGGYNSRGAGGSYWLDEVVVTP